MKIRNTRKLVTAFCAQLSYLIHHWFEKKYLANAMRLNFFHLHLRGFAIQQCQKENNPDDHKVFRVVSNAV